MELIALASVFVACTLAYGSDEVRGTARWATMAPVARRRVARLLAVLLVIAAFVLWHRAEPGPAAFLAIPAGVMASGTLVALLGPVCPRWLAALGIAALPVALLLTALGGSHG